MIIGRKKRKGRDLLQNKQLLLPNENDSNPVLLKSPLHLPDNHHFSNPIVSDLKKNTNNNGSNRKTKKYNRLNSDSGIQTGKKGSNDGKKLLPPGYSESNSSNKSWNKRGSTESWESFTGGFLETLPISPGEGGDQAVMYPAEYSLLGNANHRRVSAHRVSYRKAIQKAGYNMNELEIPSTLSPTLQRKIVQKDEVDWSESAACDDHIWAPTSASGDLCYVGETSCTKSGSRKKCSACHIVVHDNCFAQLVRIGFRCKITFREPASRGARENLVVHHHWVHRRKQEGKCKSCGKAFEKRFGFREATKIVAISCSWCKEAFHNKVSCFQLHKINEPCTLGSFSKSIVPSTWILKNSLKQKSLRNRSKKKKGSTGTWRKRSSKESKPKTFILRPLSHQVAFVSPTLVFINPKSGGNQGAKLMQSFLWSLNPRQVFDLSKGGPQEALELYRKVPNLRILACGGDGTVGWILSVLDKLNMSRPPPVAILPLGTGNDLSRTLNFGPGYTDESVQKIIQGVEDAKHVKLDRWKIIVEKSDGVHLPNPEDEMDDGVDKPPLDVINNYLSIGSDAAVSLDFHNSREAHPGKFKSRFGNKIFYARAGVQEYVTRDHSKDLSKHISLWCDGKNLTPKIRELKPVCLIFLNIPRYSSGTCPWGNPTGGEFRAQRHDDRLIEVLAFSLNQLGMLFVGGHGDRLVQCRSILMKTSRTFPIQVDGEPCRLNPCNLKIEFFNQANMLQKIKRRPSLAVTDGGQDKIKIKVNVIGNEEYQEMNGKKEQLCATSTPLLVTVVAGNANLETVRSCLEALNPADRGSDVLSDQWTFLDASDSDKFYRIDRSQESLHILHDVFTSDRELYILEQPYHGSSRNSHGLQRANQVSTRHDFRSRVHSDPTSKIESAATKLGFSSVSSLSPVANEFPSEFAPAPPLDVVFEHRPETNGVTSVEDVTSLVDDDVALDEPLSSINSDTFYSAQNSLVDFGVRKSNEAKTETQQSQDSGIGFLPASSDSFSASDESRTVAEKIQAPIVPTSTTSSPASANNKIHIMCESDCSSYSTSSNEYLVADEFSPLDVVAGKSVARTKSFMSQRSFTKSSTPPTSGGGNMLLGEFVSKLGLEDTNKEIKPKTEDPKPTTSSDGQSPMLLSDFVKGLKNENNNSNRNPNSVIAKNAVLQNKEDYHHWRKMLFDASKRGDVKKLILACKHGVHVSMKDDDGYTALHHASRFNHEEMVNYLLENGSKELLEMGDTTRQQTALHKAAWYGHVGICKTLLQVGASLTAVDIKGHTPIDQAKKAESSELVKLLVEEQDFRRKKNRLSCHETDL